MSHIFKSDSKLWPCVLGGVAVGTALGVLISRGMSGFDSGTTEKKKTSHLGVHVLLVNLEFASADALRTWCWEFQAQAGKVYANEPECLSYEVCP